MEEINERKEEMLIEIRTLEELLKDLREEKSWSYINIIEELNKLGIRLLDDKKVKKWELGLEYPDLEIIYKLSELYSIPSEQFIIAKNNSFKKGIDYIHITFIKWFCYFTGISLKIALIGLYVVLACALIWSFTFFISKCNEYLEVRRIMNH